MAAAAVAMALAPAAAHANTRASGSTTYYATSANAQPGLQRAPAGERRKAALISREDLSSILMLAGGFTVAFALILAGGQGENSSRRHQNQSNGAN